MFIVWIITNLKNKKGGSSKQDFEVDGSLENFFCSLVTLKLNPFIVFCTRVWPLLLKRLKKSSEIKANTLALFINSVTITRKVKNEQLMNKVSLCSLLLPPHE